MQNRQVILLLQAIYILWMIAATPLHGQFQRSPGELALNQMAAKGTMIPAGQASFELPFVIDPSAGGGEWLHVYRSVESTTVTLRNPGGTIIDAETAGGMGFAWLERTIAITADSGLDAGDGLDLVSSSIGTHTIIHFPGGQPTGTYSLVFDAGSAAVQTLVTVEFWTNSPVVAEARTDETRYRTGDFVSATAEIDDGRRPVANATVTGRSMASRDVTDSVVVSGATLLDKSDLGNGLSHYRFRVQLQNNTASSVWRFAAQAETFEENVRVVRAVLEFPPMAPGTSALSADSISVIAPTAPNFDASGLEWDVTAKSPPVALAFADVSAVNDTPGDGVYGARFQPAEPGDHVISLDINGTTAAGTPFYRNAATEFTVAAAQATVASITSEGIDANGNQKYEALRFIAGIDVQEAGEYTLSFLIRDSAQRGYTFRRTTQLAAGAGSITQEVSAKDLLENGIGNGPFSIVGVTLRRDVLDRSTVVDYHATMGVTPAYNLGDFERGSNTFTGHGNEVAVSLDGQTGYDRAAMTPVGVAAQESHPQTGGCSMDSLSRGCFSGLAGRGAYAPRWLMPPSGLCAAVYSAGSSRDCALRWLRVNFGLRANAMAGT